MLGGVGVGGFVGTALAARAVRVGPVGTVVTRVPGRAVGRAAPGRGVGGKGGNKGDVGCGAWPPPPLPPPPERWVGTVVGTGPVVAVGPVVTVGPTVGLGPFVAVGSTEVGAVPTSSTSIFTESDAAVNPRPSCALAWLVIRPGAVLPPTCTTMLIVTG